MVGVCRLHHMHPGFVTGRALIFKHESEVLVMPSRGPGDKDSLGATYGVREWLQIQAYRSSISHLCSTDSPVHSCDVCMVSATGMGGCFTQPLHRAVCHELLIPCPVWRFTIEDCCSLPPDSLASPEVNRGKPHPQPSACLCRLLS